MQDRAPNEPTPLKFTFTSCSRFAAESAMPVSTIGGMPRGHKRMARPLLFRPMRCWLSTPQQPSPLGFELGDRRQSPKKSGGGPPSVIICKQAPGGSLEGGLPPVRLPSPVMHAASPMNSPAPRRTMTTWNIVRGIGVALPSPNDNCACGDTRKHHFAACHADRKLSGSVN